MYELLRVTLELCCQHAYKRNGRGAGQCRLAVQGRHIEQFYPATGRDYACRLLRDHPGASFRTGERGLKRQHSPHMRLRGERGGHLRRASPAWQPHLWMFVAADDAGVDVAEAINLRTAEETNRDATALQPVLEHLWD